MVLHVQSVVTFRVIQLAALMGAASVPFRESQDPGGYIEIDKRNSVSGASRSIKRFCIGSAY